MQGMKGGGKGKHEKLSDEILQNVSKCNPKTEVMCEFANAEEECVENCVSYNVKIVRKGDMGSKLLVKWKVIEEDAILGEHFNVKLTECTIPRNAATAEIFCDIVDDNDKNPDRHFTLIITDIEVLEGSVKSIVGDKKSCRITILDDDIPGFFELSQPN